MKLARFYLFLFQFLSFKMQHYRLLLLFILLPSLLFSQPMTEDEIYAELEETAISFQEYHETGDVQAFQQYIFGRAEFVYSEIDGSVYMDECEYEEGIISLVSTFNDEFFASGRAMGSVLAMESRFRGPVVFAELATDKEGIDTRYGNEFALLDDTLEQSLQIEQCNLYGPVSISDCELQVTAMEGGQNYDATEIKNCNLGQSLSFREMNFGKGLLIADCTLPDTLRLASVTLDAGLIKITRCVLDADTLQQNPDYRCVLVLDEIDPNLLDFEYKYFDLHVDNRERFELNSSKYDGLLTRFNALGYVSSYEELDKQFRAFTYLNEDPESPQKLLNHLDNWWWGYGYDKIKIVRNTILVLAFFVFFNGLFLRSFLMNVYDLREISESESFQKNWERHNPVTRFFVFLPTTIFVTSLIFFGLNFELDKLSYGKNLGWRRIPRVAYFFIIYLSGLFCLAYLVNFVLNQ